MASLGRRTAIVLLAGGAGLALGAGWWWRRGRGERPPPKSAAAPGELHLGARLRITPDGEVRLRPALCEMGQGIHTALALLVAEELDADWSRLRLDDEARLDEALGSQYTGASLSVARHQAAHRRLGASARAMLLAAAARRWQVEAGHCRTEPGAVLGPGGRRLGYGELAADAQREPVPARVALKPRSAWRLLGHGAGRLDTPAVVTGQAVYGSDFRLPGLLHATIERPPPGAGPRLAAALEAAAALPGVAAVIDLPAVGEAPGGLAVLAEHPWQALKARRALQARWRPAARSDDGPAAWRAAAEARGPQPGQAVRHDEGDVPAALAGAARQVQALYDYPCLAHAALEPLSCTAWQRDGRLTLWAASQNPADAREQVARALALEPGRIEIVLQRCGGAFGRRLASDHLLEAAALALRSPRPLRLTWTREDEFAHDRHRPAGFHHLRAGLDRDGRLLAWQEHALLLSADGRQPAPGAETPAAGFPLRSVPHGRVEHSLIASRAASGPWRSPGHNGHAFAVQGFLDEVAAAAGADPLAFRLDLLGRAADAGEAARSRAVLDDAARRAGWPAPTGPHAARTAAGRALGLAFQAAHGGHAAVVVEVSLPPAALPVVHRVVVSVDVGDTLVNPSGARAQVEGAVIDGLSAALFQRFDPFGEAAAATNFDRYRLLRLAEAPAEIDIGFVASAQPPAGLGETVLALVAPALCNAIARAGGRRIRSLPVAGQDLGRPA